MPHMQILPLRVTDILDFAALNHAREGLVSYDAQRNKTSFTYAELRHRSRRALSALCTMGVGRGARVASLAWNDHRHFELYYAIPGAGAAIHTLNPRLPAEQIASLVDEVGDTIMFYDSTLSDLACEIAAASATSFAMVQMGGGRPELEGALLYDDLLDQHREESEWAQIDENDAAVICFTSGTSGKPKGVVYTHRSTVLHAMAACMVDGQAISSAERILPAVPMFHANAWGLIHSAPMVGANLILPGPNLHGSVLAQTVREEEATLLCGVPTIWHDILANSREEGLGSLKRAGVGGAKPSAQLIRELEERGISVMHSWGMTETNPTASTGTLSGPEMELPLDARLQLKQSQGRPVFGIERRCVDDEGNIAPRDGEALGHLQVRGHWVVDTYLGASQSAVEEGWFETGDIARMTEDGRIWLADRSKDLIKSGGEWISSLELEAVALEVEGVASAAAIARPHPRWGERPILIVSRNDSSSRPAASDILAAYSGKMQSWQVPDDVIFIDELPLNSTGKVDKLRLRAAFAKEPVNVET